MRILGISAFYHDSAAALIDDGMVVAAAQEERFTRKKFDPNYPRHAIDYCLTAGEVALADIDYVAFYEKPFLKFNPGEHMIMGLALYGTPRFARLIYDNLLDLKPDGSFRLNLDYFNYCTGLTMTNERFHDLFGGPPRKSAVWLEQRDMDLAASV